MTCYAIGDIHGHLDKLTAAHELIEADRAREGLAHAPVIHVGDLIDRGPDSAGVVAFLRALTLRDPRQIVLKGNHDHQLLLFLEDVPRWDHHLRPGMTWLDPKLGGLDTLASYGIDPTLPLNALHRAARDQIPAGHIAFLNALPLSHWHGNDLFFAHAGIRPGIPFDYQDPEDLMWIRHEFLDDPSDHGPLIVHGHTSTKRVEHHGNRLNIDTGAGFNRALSAVVLEGRRAFLLTPSGRQDVTPKAQTAT